MKRNFGSLQEELGSALQAAFEEPNPTRRYQSCVGITESAIKRMKEMVEADPFSTPREEIHHFKQEAPEFYSQLFFYRKLVVIEVERAHATAGRFQEFLRDKIAVQQQFLDQQADFCRYYYAQFTYQDEYLFLRNPTGQWSGDDVDTYIPPDLTVGAYWISCVRANDRLREWLREQLAASIRLEASRDRRGLVHWTGSRVNCISLFCALHLAGCFNNNTLKEVMDWVQEELGVNTRQFHVALHEASLRRDPVGFIKNLVEVMQRKFNSMLD